MASPWPLSPCRAGSCLRSRTRPIAPRCSAARRVLESRLGHDHPRLWVTLNNLAAVHFVRGDLLLAEALYWWALSNREQRFGPDHPDVALTVANLGVLMRSTGKLEAAESLFERAVRIFERPVTADHPHAVTCARNYADLLRQLGRENEAEPLDRR